jgi:hypothetical protein
VLAFIIAWQALVVWIMWRGGRTVVAKLAAIEKLLSVTATHSEKLNVHDAKLEDHGERIVGLETRGEDRRH